MKNNLPQIERFLDNLMLGEQYFGSRVLRMSVKIKPSAHVDCSTMEFSNKLGNFTYESWDYRRVDKSDIMMKLQRAVDRYESVESNIENIETIPVDLTCEINYTTSDQPHTSSQTEWIPIWDSPHDELINSAKMYSDL